MVFLFFKQKTAYEMRISDWSSDVCSSDLRLGRIRLALGQHRARRQGEAARRRQPERPRTRRPMEQSPAHLIPLSRTLYRPFPAWTGCFVFADRKRVV